MDGVVCKIMVEFCDHLSYTKKLLTMLKTIKNKTSKGNTMYLVWGSLSTWFFRQEGDELHRPSYLLLPENSLPWAQGHSSWCSLHQAQELPYSVDMLHRHIMVLMVHGPWSMIWEKGRC